MGTRNLTVIIMDGKTRVAQYGQWDGHPTSAGSYIVDFLKTADLAHFRQQLAKYRLLPDDEYRKLTKNIKDNREFGTSYPQFNRDNGYHIPRCIYNDSCSLYDEKKHHANPDLNSRQCYTEFPITDFVLCNYYEFAAESLFCEWGYVIDLDNEVLEIYEGFNKRPLTEKDRFFPLQVEGGDEGYYPIRLAASFPFKELPDFVVLENVEAGNWKNVNYFQQLGALAKATVKKE